MKTYTVKPLSSKRENICLIITIATIFILSGILLQIRIKPINTQKISKTEISSYKELNSIELGVYSEILNSLTEIEMLIKNNKYPSIAELENEEIPPFSKTTMINQEKDISWKLTFHDGTPLYIGSSTNTKKIGNFIIQINGNDITKSDIFYSKEPIDFYIVEKDFETAKSKMKKIIPYTGADERKKFKED